MKPAAAGGTAWLLRLDADNAQSVAFSGMFDRTSAYAELLADMAHFDPLAENVTTANKFLRVLRRRYETLVEQDYFPGAGKVEAEARLLTLEATLASRLSPTNRIPRTASPSVSPSPISRSRPGPPGRTCGWIGWRPPG